MASELKSMILQNKVQAIIKRISGHVDLPKEAYVGDVMKLRGELATVKMQYEMLKLEKSNESKYGTEVKTKIDTSFGEEEEKTPQKL